MCGCTCFGGHWHWSLSQRWLFPWVGTGQGTVVLCSAQVGSSHSLAEVEKMELIYLEEQIKINLSRFFCASLKECMLCCRSAGQHWGSCEGHWEI